MGRRQMLMGLSALPLLPAASFAKTKGKVIIIGGGFGGSTAAQSLKTLAPHIDITLIEPNPIYAACPYSNLVIGNARDISDQRFGYDALHARGINIVHDVAAAVDPEKQTVQLKTSKARLPYDRLIMSPGIDMRWNAIDGYDAVAAKDMPHAWKAGQQTLTLRQQLLDMKDGGIFVMSVPRAPYRCPPGPYERASLIAHYLKNHKPRSKLIILDAKDSFSKQALFEQAWRRDYSDIIEWRGASDDGIVGRIDKTSREIFTDFETIKADAANIIPPQMAGHIARQAGVTNSTDWCPINAVSFESRLQNNIHIIGDAAIAAPMPKSAFAANLQGKLCAIQIARLLSGLAAQPTLLTNTCYSYIGPSEAVSITGVYRNDGGAFSQIKDAGGTSSLIDPQTSRAEEAAQAQAWFAAITGEAFG